MGEVEGVVGEVLRGAVREPWADEEEDISLGRAPKPQEEQEGLIQDRVAPEPLLASQRGMLKTHFACR